MTVLESFEELKNQVVKADSEIMTVAEKDEPTIESKLQDATRESDQQAATVKATLSATPGSESPWQQFQADWERHVATMRSRLASAKSGYELTVTEGEAEAAEADALNAIAVASSAVLEAEQAALAAILARRRAIAVVSA
jgi:hypothetical protein